MNTSIFTLALTAALLSGNNAAPTWQTNYGQAREQGAAQKKPLAIVFGNGADSWTKNPTPEIAKLLGDRYVCVFIDTAQPAGKKLADDCAIASGVGLVISDQKCETQAFWHQGDMTSDNVLHYLKKYADPLVVVGGTETVNTVRTSYYPSQTPTRTSSANC